MKLKSLAAAALIALSSPSWAVTQDLGVIDTSGAGFSRTFVRVFDFLDSFGGDKLGAFTDYYTFAISGGNAAAGGAFVNLDLGGLDLALTSISLTGDGLNYTDTSPADFSFGNLAGNTTYTLAVSGNLSQQSYDAGILQYEGTIRSVASAAPEPSALALALAGVLGVAALARRRRAG